MTTLNPASLVMLMIAVEMRLEGATWKEIGRKVKRHERTCRRWPLLYIREWNRLYYQADDQVATRVGLRARAVLNRDLDSKNDTTRGTAARALNKSLDQRRALAAHLDAGEQWQAAQYDSRVIKMIEHVKGLPYEERMHKLQEALEQLRAGDDRGGGGGEPVASLAPSE